MHAIAAVLDREHSQRLMQLWDELLNRYGVISPCAEQIPHISLHVAQDYDIQRLYRCLTYLSTNLMPFVVRTVGIGFFPGAIPVVHLPVVRCTELMNLYEATLPCATKSARRPSRYYDSERWLPHITLAQVNPEHSQFAEIIRDLCLREFYWEIVVDNIAIISTISRDNGIIRHISF